MAVMSFPGTGATLTFEWHPSPLVLAENFYQGAAFLEDLRRPLIASQTPAIESMNRRFDTKTDPGGGAWPEWSDSYAAVATGSLGERTGAMRAAATSREAFPVTNNEMFFSGAGLPDYWEWFNDGTGSKHSHLVEEMASAGFEWMGGTQPPRPFVGIDEEAQFEILEIFDLWVNEGAEIILWGGGAKGGRIVLRDPGGRFMKAPA